MGTTTDNSSINILSTDQWADFLQTAKDSNALTDFQSQGTTCSCKAALFSGSTPPLVFSSAQNQHDFPDASPVDFDDGSSMTVLRKAKGGVLMGLDSNASGTSIKDHSFEDVQNAFGVTGGFDGTFGLIMNTLKTLPSIAVDLDRPGSASWILPTDKNTIEVTTKLCYKVTQITPEEVFPIGSILSDIGRTFGFTPPSTTADLPPTDIEIIFSAKTTLTKADPASPVAADRGWTVTVKLPTIEGFTLFLSHSKDGTTTLSITQGPGASISDHAGPPNGAPSGAFDPPKWEGTFDNFRIWYVDVTLPSHAWAVSFILNFKQTVCLGLTYNSESKKFAGQLLVKKGLPVDSQKLWPTYLDSHNLPNDPTIIIPEEADLQSLTGTTFPHGIPTKINKASVKFNPNPSAAAVVDEDKYKLIIEGEFGTKPTASTGPQAPAPFDWTNTTFLFRKDPLHIEVHSHVDLNPPPPAAGDTGPPIPKGTIQFDLIYESSWSLSAVAKEINFGVLGGFFDKSNNSQNLLHSALGKLTIQNLTVKYAFDDQLNASSFLFMGQIVFGNLELDVYYQNSSNAGKMSDLIKALDPPAPANLIPVAPENGKSAWEFDAFLSSHSKDATLEEIFKSIDDTINLPGFIGKIQVSASDSANPLISLKIKKDDVKDVVVFDLQVQLDFLKFSFIQIIGDGDTKRILRLSIGALPIIDSIPLVTLLPQPYQELEYCWVGGTGLTMDDVNLLNGAVDKSARIYYKQDTEKQDLALKPGNHFIVINNDECIVDHVFGTSDSNANTTSPQAQPLRRRVLALASDEQTPQTEPENPPTKGSMNKQTDFLTITAISLQVKGSVLWVFLDATLKLGPTIELNMIGFGIGLKLDNINLNNLSHIDLKNDLTWQLHGLAMAFDQPPVTIAGVFEHENENGIDSYRGGIAVGLVPYDFVAVGEYAEVTQGGENYKSIFIYAKLDGPIVDLEIAIIKGVRLGFGFNSFVRSPSVQELPNFPFINDVGIGGAGNNPMKILQAMRGGDNPWVQVKHDSYWFALGFSVSTFDIITATAVAMLEFSNQGVVANIFADVIAQMPPDATRETSIVYVELLLNAELNFIYDFFFVQAALAPTSFLLVPQCHLFGGFAIGSWFGKSDYAGDWVFTVGGYHKQFQVPDHYPKPDRLGIKFSIGDNMTIGGEGYFAITPKAVMGGAMIYVQLHVGPVSAHLNAGFDALLEFHPLHYIVDVYVDVGVSCHVDVLFISGDISVDIGASLHIEGPNFGGVAHVDFWFFAFDVNFGSSPHKPDRLHLDKFYDIVSKAGPPEDNTPPGDKAEEKHEIHLKFGLEDGAFPKAPKKTTDTNAPPESAGAGSDWRVRGGNFQFRVSSVFAISAATIATEHVPDVVPIKTPVEIWSKPMEVTQPIQSPLKITIRKVEDGTIAEGWKSEFVIKRVPVALWGHPETPKEAALDNTKNGYVELPMAVSISAPDPVLAPSKIPPVNATDINRLLAPNGQRDIPLTNPQSEFYPATLDKTPKGWKDMQTAWETATMDSLDVAKTMANVCMKSLGWNTPPPEVLLTKATGATPWELKVDLPERLVTGTGGAQEGVEDGLANTYLALPRVIAV